MFDRFRIHLLMWVAFSVVAGCKPAVTSVAPRTSAQTDSATPAAEPVAAAPARETPPPLEGWNTPAGVLLITGETKGYFEPCGCSPTQSGGLSRRGDFFRWLRDDKQWPMAAVDLGGSVRRTRKQDLIKYEVLADSWKQLGYSATTMAPAELQLGADQMLTLMPADEESKEKFQWLAANVVLFDQPDLGFPAASRLLTVGNLKIGVAAVIGLSQKDQVEPAGVVTNVALTDPKAALARVIEAWEPQRPNLLVLLSHGTPEEAKELAAAFPQFAIVVTAHGYEDPGNMPPEKVGNTYMWQVGAKGKYVGVVGLYPGDAENPLRFERVELDNVRFNPSPAMENQMKQYQNRLQQEDIFRNPELTVAHPSGLKYVGAAKCGECHTKAFAKWEKSKHAHAYDTLQVGRKGQEATWVSRVFDPECLSCHVTGWQPQEMLRYDSGYLDEASTAHLKGQQCENCHGPGSQHTDVEWMFRKDQKSVPRDEVFAARKTMHRRATPAEHAVCKQCHDGDNSPNFKFEKYWEEVRHPWRD